MTLLFQPKQVHESVWPWYNFVFSPEQTAKDLIQTLNCGVDQTTFTTELTQLVTPILTNVHKGLYIDEICSCLGKGEFYAVLLPLHVSYC